MNSTTISRGISLTPAASSEPPDKCRRPDWFCVSMLMLFAAVFSLSSGTVLAAFAITTLEENEVITDLEVLRVTHTRRPDCAAELGPDWHLLSVDLNHGLHPVGTGSASEPAFYLCYQTASAVDAEADSVQVVNLVYVIAKPNGGLGSCHAGDLMLSTNINEGPGRGFEEYVCVKKTGIVDAGIAGIMIHQAPHEHVDGGGWSVEPLQFFVPGFDPWVSFNNGGTPLSLHVLLEFSDRTQAFFECGGEDEPICSPDSGFTGGVEGNRCDRGLANVNGICRNATGLRARRRDAVDNYLATDAGRLATWAINNQRNDLAIDEPINWFSQLASHNAANNSSDGYTSPNQPFSITDQLRLGVRVFLIDLAWLGEAVRLVHGDTCCATDRLFSNLVKELANWLDAHPTDVIVVYTEDYTPTPESDYMINDTIERYLGGRVFVLEEVGASERWPTRREMLAAGKQIIFATQHSAKEHGGDRRVQSDQPQGYLIFGERGPWIRYATLTWVKPHETLIESSLLDCLAYTRGGGFTFNRIEDGLRIPEQTLDEDEIHILARCNFPMISINDIDQHGRINSIVWSWAPGETGSGTHAAFSFLQLGGRWFSSWGSQFSYHFACATPVEPEPLDRPQGDQTGYARAQEWRVTQTTGTWDQGFAACRDEFGSEGMVFSVPVNGWQNENLKLAFLSAGIPPTDNVWLNYHKVGDRWTPNCLDSDGDGFLAGDCGMDCDDAEADTYPGAPEVCDGINNDCEHPHWPVPAADDRDDDGDGFCADDCNDGDALINPAARELCNDKDDDCNGLVDDDELGVDSDADLVRNACDNCVVDYNPNQTDFDDDSQGDHCDLDDGIIYILFSQAEFVEWQAEEGYDTWNSYRGDLETLSGTGVYTQVLGSNPLAGRECGLVDPFVQDPLVPGEGKVAFYLTTGVKGGESGLGDGRPNDNPCP